jgi:hypothetical protein
MKPDWRALAFLAAFCAAFLAFPLLRGCGGGKPRPTEPDAQPRLADRRHLLDRRADELAAAADAYAPADAARLDDL